MLLPPQREQFFWQPAPVPPQFVDERVAGRTQRDEPAAGMAAGPAVVHHALFGSPTALAAVAVADEHVFAMAGEMAEGMAVPAIAGGAETGDRRQATAGQTEQRTLPQEEQRPVYRR